MLGKCLPLLFPVPKHGLFHFFYWKLYQDPSWDKENPWIKRPWPLCSELRELTWASFSPVLSLFSSHSMEMIETCGQGGGWQVLCSRPIFACWDISEPQLSMWVAEVFIFCSRADWQCSSRGRIHLTGILHCSRSSGSPVPPNVCFDCRIGREMPEGT